MSGGWRTKKKPLKIAANGVKRILVPLKTTRCERDTVFRLAGTKNFWPNKTESARAVALLIRAVEATFTLIIAMIPGAFAACCAASVISVSATFNMTLVASKPLFTILTERSVEG